MTSLRLSTHQHRLSPILVAGLAFLIAMFVVASLAAAHVVQVTTAIDIADVKSPHEFERALLAEVHRSASAWPTCLRIVSATTDDCAHATLTEL